MERPFHHSAPSKVAETRARLLHLVDGLDEGAMLPPERELARLWEVSRMTLRRAMDDLVLEELLVRRQGIGTFTCRPKVLRRLAMTSFSADVRRRGMRPGSRIVELRRHHADRSLSQQLHIPVGDPVVRFTRLRLADDTPLALERTSIAEARVPGLRAEDLNASWYELLAERYGLDLQWGTSRIEATLPDADTAALLEIPTSRPCLAVHTTSRDARGRVVEIAADVYRSDHYALTTEVRLPRPPASRVIGS